MYVYIYIVPVCFPLGGENVRNITGNGKVYRLNMANLTTGTHRLFVKPTDGCSLYFCNKSMRYKFTVKD